MRGWKGRRDEAQREDPQGHKLRDRGDPGGLGTIHLPPPLVFLSPIARDSTQFSGNSLDSGRLGAIGPRRGTVIRRSCGDVAFLKI